MTKYRYSEERLGLLSNGTEMKKQAVFLDSRRKLKEKRDNSFKKRTSSGLGWEVISGLQKAWGLYLVLKE